MPPLDTTVPLAMPPATISVPPPVIEVLMPVPPKLTFSPPPLRIVVALSNPPDATNTAGADRGAEIGPEGKDFERETAADDETAEDFT